MSTASEIPAITDFAASGTGVFFVHVIRDASGQVMSGTVDYTVNYTLASAVTFTGLHFHTGGAAVNVQIKSGTNQLHGSFYERNQNNAMTATGYFNHAIPSHQISAP